MFKELIDAIKAGYDARTLQTSDGSEYTTKQVHLPPAEPTADPIQVSTLTGVVDYITANFDQVIKDCHIRIVSPTQVVIENQVWGRHQQRTCYLVADCAESLSRFPFGKFMGTDEAVIKLQAHFRDEGDRAALLSHVGTVLHESSLEVNDDGVTQKTVNRSGIARKTEGELKNPITLIPYRTFADIAQPESDFIFRLQSSDRGGIQFALFESGDLQWRLLAIDEIKSYLQGALAETDYANTPILA